MNFIKSFFIFIFLFSSSYLIAGGPWVQPKGQGFYKVGLWGLIADSHFTDSGMIDPNVTTGLFNVSLYAERGITNRLTGILYFPFFSRTYYNNVVSETSGEIIEAGEAINSIGDIDLTIKYGILVNKPIVLSASLTLGLPTGNPSGGDKEILQTGDGEFNQMISVDVGGSASVGKVNFYGAATVGFNNRTNGFSDEVRYGIEIGAVSLNEKLITTLRFTGNTSLKNGSSTEVPSGTSLFANDSETFSWSPEIGYMITPKIGASIAYHKAFSGKLIFANAAWSGGIFIKI